VVVLIAGVLMLVLPRKKALIPFLVASILIPMDQILVVGGVHLQMLRVLALFGIARLIREKLAGRKLFAGGINKIDWAFILLTALVAINAVVLFRNFGVVITQVGTIYTAFGVYFLLR
jgi:hypothetical protein